MENMKKELIQKEKAELIVKKMKERETKQNKVLDQSLSNTGAASQTSFTETLPQMTKGAFKFEKYTSRKDPYEIKQSSDVITYVDSTRERKKMNCTLNFRKMTNRKDSSSKGSPPAVATYHPKYEVIEERKKLSKVFYNKVMPFLKLDKKKEKKYKLNKLWRSYNVTTDYKIVKFESFLAETEN